MNRLSDELLYKTIRDYFVVYLPKMRNCSDNTIRSYKKTLLSLLEYLSKKPSFKYILRVSNDFF